MKIRIFFATDIHGSDVCFKKFINAAKYYNANVLILGGDITGKMIIPIIEKRDGNFLVDYMGKTLLLKTKDDLEKIKKNIMSSGAYFYHISEVEWENLSSDKSKIDELFSHLIQERLKCWVKFADERLKNSDVKCFINPGNDDAFFVDNVLKQSDHIVVPEGQVINIDDKYEMISTGYANITPWHCPRDIPEEQLMEKIDEMISKVKNMENCIFNFHCPPFNTTIDIAPKLDESFKYKLTPGGEPEKVPVGSVAVRKAIEKYQPLLGLHGHIHESRGFIKIGRTLCLNPGSEYSEGVLRGVLVELHKNKLDFIFTEG
jgi:Icc-related predicted phosphoesterase